MIEEILLNDRSIIEIKGDDRKNFLQGLISNDINKAQPNTLIYAAMLNATGRFLYDFFIFEKNNSLFLDCLSSRRDEIFTKFKFYKLRSKVELSKNDDYQILQNIDGNSTNQPLTFNDPRNKNLGQRIYRESNLTKNNSDTTKYHYKRINLKIPESEHDLTYEKSIIAEFGFDDLNAVDYKKGCYIGQELTARTHFMGQVRKKIFHIKIENLQKLEKNSEISCEGKNVGIILSTIYYENELHALALIKINEDINETQQKYAVQENKITIIN